PRGDHEAEVASSDGSKRYSVKWDASLEAFSSNDNGSHWRGYVGYPIIAVLMYLGKIVFSIDVIRPLAGVPWKRLNDEAKRDYDAVVEQVLKGIESRGLKRAAIEDEANSVYEQLKGMKLSKLTPMAQRSAAGVSRG